MEAARAEAGVLPVATSGRMPSGERRQQIVQVAMRLFSERGFRGTTTKEIAHAAGVSEAIIFRHFATKEELYSAIIDHKACAGGMREHAHQTVAETIRCSVAEAMERRDDRAVFEGIAETMMRHHEQDEEFLRLLFYSALEKHQLSQMFWDRNMRLMYDFLGSYIRERQRDGVFGNVDPLVVVRAFMGMIIHHSVTNTLWDRSRTLLNIPNERAARDFTRILLEGIGASGGAKTGAAVATATTSRVANRRSGSQAARSRKKS
jgi:AcrR family transcriptional regulator